MMEDYIWVHMKGSEFDSSEANKRSRQTAMGIPTYAEIVKASGDTLEEYYEILNA